MHRASWPGHDHQRARRAARFHRRHDTGIACGRVAGGWRTRSMARRAIGGEHRHEIRVDHGCWRGRGGRCWRCRCWGWQRWGWRRCSRRRLGTGRCCRSSCVGWSQRNPIRASRKRDDQRGGWSEGERAGTHYKPHLVLRGTRRPVEKMPAVKPLLAWYRSYCTVSPVPSGSHPRLPAGVITIFPV